MLHLTLQNNVENPLQLLTADIHRGIPTVDVSGSLVVDELNFDTDAEIGPFVNDNDMNEF